MSRYAAPRSGVRKTDGTACDFRANTQRYCEKCRISTFFANPLDKGSPDFSTKLSHFSPAQKRIIHTKIGDATLKIPLFYKVLHIFHRVIHKRTLFSWFDAVENSDARCADLVEKRNMSNVTKIRGFSTFPDRWGHFRRAFGGKNAGRAAPFFLCGRKKSVNPLYKLPTIAYNIGRIMT